MARRELQEINAGSMADIAFLLLIFFLVTTTMDQDKGILRQLPPIMEVEVDVIVKQRNVFEVLVNANDDLLVEGEEMNIGDLKESAMEFLTNSGIFRDEVVDENLTEREWVRKSAVVESLGKAKAGMQQYPDKADQYESSIKKYEAQLDAINMFGEYKELKPSAVISLQNDMGTSYDMYIQVQNELTSAINQLRDDLVQEKFGKSYVELDEKVGDDRKIIMAVRQIFPQRISEAEPKEIG
jgi:hypothetical protein